jgi:hypothetical protein
MKGGGYCRTPLKIEESLALASFDLDPLWLKSLVPLPFRLGDPASCTELLPAGNPPFSSHPPRKPSPAGAPFFRKEPERRS